MPQTTTWTGAAGDSDWTNSNNWDNGAPTSDSDVVIPAGAVVDIPAGANGSIHSLNNSGTLTSAVDIAAIAITNTASGQIRASGDGTTVKVTAPTVSNQGTFYAGFGATLNVASDSFDNLSGGDLTGGYDVHYDIVDPLAGGTPTSLNLIGGGAVPITTLDARVSMSGDGDTLSSGGVSLQDSLTTIGSDGTLALYYGYNSGTVPFFVDPNSFEIAGTLELHDADFYAGGTDDASQGLYVDATAKISGTGILAASGNGGGNFVTLHNDGTITAIQDVAQPTGPLDIQAADIVGNGTFQIVGAQKLEFSAVNQDTATGSSYAKVSGTTIQFHADGNRADAQTLTIDGGEEIVDGESTFKATIDGFSQGDIVDLPGIVFDAGQGDAYGFSNHTLTFTHGDGTIFGQLTFGDLADGTTFAITSGAGTQIQLNSGNSDPTAFSATNNQGVSPGFGGFSTRVQAPYDPNTNPNAEEFRPGAPAPTIVGVGASGQTLVPVPQGYTFGDASHAGQVYGTYSTLYMYSDGSYGVGLLGDATDVLNAIEATSAKQVTDNYYYQVGDGRGGYSTATITVNFNDIQYNNVDSNGAEAGGTTHLSDEVGQTIDVLASTSNGGSPVFVFNGAGGHLDEQWTVKVVAYDDTDDNYGGPGHGTLSVDTTVSGGGGTVTPIDNGFQIVGTLGEIQHDLATLKYTGTSIGHDSIDIDAIHGLAESNQIIGDVAVACYCAGTRILTPGGAVPVETLSAGDRVVTASGEHRPIVWIGHRTIDLIRHPKPQAVRPVRFAAGALGPDLPVRDLLLSPDHALWLEGALVPAERLINGATIRQESWSRVDYFHVELETHDILLAENVPAESYLDCDNRHGFENSADGIVTLHADWRAAAASRVFASPALSTRLRAAFVERAGTLGRRAEVEHFFAAARARAVATRTNIVRNPRAEGALAGRIGQNGRAPTHWWLSAPDGVAIDVVRLGHDDGLPFLDLRVSGRSETDQQVCLYPEPGAVPAQAGQDWTASCHMRLTEGSLDGIEAVSLYIDEYAADGAYVAGGAVAQALPTKDDLALQRLVATRRLRAHQVAGTTSYLQIRVKAGAPIDVTVRLAGMQIEQGDYASDLMLPAPGTIEATHRVGPETPMIDEVCRRVA